MGRLGAIVLAAGGSTRLGRPKQLIEFQGTTLLQQAVRNVQVAGAKSIVVVLGGNAEQCIKVLPQGVTAVVNESWQQGMGGSLRLGAQSLAPNISRAFIVLCDQPHVTAQTLGRLSEQMAKSNPDACVSSFAGTRGPPVVVNARLIERLKSWPNDQGAKRLWSDPVIDVDDIEAPEAAADVDTEADVERYLKD